MVAPVTIRPVALADAADIQRYAAAPQIAATSRVPHPYPADGGIVFVADALRAWEQGARYAVAILCDGALAGIVSLRDVDAQQGTAELAYWVAVPFWGRGVATAAARLAIHYAFAKLGLSALCIPCHGLGTEHPFPIK